MTGTEDSRPESDRKAKPGSPLAWIALVFCLLILATFVTNTEGIRHPLILSAAVVFLLFPWMRDRRVSRTVQTVLGLTILWFLFSIEEILTPLLVAGGLAFVCSPVFMWLKGEKGRWRPLKLNPTVASMIVTMLLFGFLGMVGAQTGTLIVSQATELSTIIEESVGRVQGIFPASWSETPLLKNLSDGIVQMVGEFGAWLPGLAGGVAGGMGFALKGMLGLLMTLVYFFYILRDSGELMRGFVKRYLPESMHSFVAGRSEKVVQILGRFVEGFFLTSSVVFVLTLLLLLVAGVRMAFLLALVAALLNIIPVIGFWVSTALILVIALASGMQMRDVLIIGAGLAAINIFEGNILQPKIIGRKVGLHPVVAILSVAIFGEILGFFGYILGVPLAAVLTSEWGEYLSRRRSRQADQA